MVTIIDARRIRDIVGGGPFQGGEGIFFTLAFPTGSHETFHCDLAFLPRLIGHLRQYSMIAAKALGAATAPIIAEPFAVEHILKSARAPDGKSITLEVQVRDGFPIELALTRRQARAAIKAIEAQLAKVPALRPRKRRK